MTTTLNVHSGQSTQSHLSKFIETSLLGMSKLFSASLLGAVAALAACSAEPEELLSEEGTSSAASTADAQHEKAYAYLAKYGYLNEKVLQFSTEELKKALLLFQEIHHLPTDGTLNAETLKLMAQPRCEYSDRSLVQRKLEVDPSASYTEIGRWTNRWLTYRHVNFTADLTQLQNEQIIAAAFAKWTAVNLFISISRVNAGGDMLMSFAVGDHGDGNAFDGPGNVLAHAVGPGPNPINGDVHFDDDEPWSLSVNGGISLPSVALHEIGHALGLGHTTASGAAMRAFYTGQEELGSDDINGIQAIYPLAPPNPVTNYNGACYGDNFVEWTPQPGATYYQLYRSSTVSFTNPILVYQGGDTSEGLNVSLGGWYLRVKSCNANGCSEFSNYAYAPYINNCP